MNNEGMPKRGRSSSLSRKAVMRMIQPEKKWFDDQFTASAVTPGTQPTTHALGTTVRTALPAATGISVASDVNARIGQKINIESLALHIRLRMDADSQGTAPATTPGLVRVCLVEDRQPNLVVPVWEASYGGQAVAFPIGENGVSGTASVLAMRNLNTSGRFRILHDRVYAIQQQMTSSAANTWELAPATKHIAIYKKFPKGVVRKYAASATTGAATGIEKNGHYLFIISDGANQGNMSYQVVSRMRYSDV